MSPRSEEFLPLSEAGARAVVATLWDVDDRATARLMDRFYDRAAQGLSAAAALRAAQLEVAGRDPYRTAPQWAGFVIAGDGAVRIGILRPAPLLSGAALIAIAAELGLLLLYHRTSAAYLIDESSEVPAVEAHI